MIAIIVVVVIVASTYLRQTALQYVPCKNLFLIYTLFVIYFLIFPKVVSKLTFELVPSV